MAGEVINIGTSANDGTGDPLRAALSKINVRFGYRVNVADYGAVGNGAADDTTAIQNAINAVNAAGGAVLQVAPGKTYIVSGLVPKPGLLLDLQGSTLKLKASFGVEVI